MNRIAAKSKFPREDVKNVNRNTEARPMPLTIPILAQVSCTEAIRGHVNRAVQSVAKPGEAPATA